MDKNYVIGIDFGTLSARATLIDISNGKEICVAVYGYQDAVIDTYLPNTDIKLPPNFALQNPRDYQDALIALLRDLPIKAKVDPNKIKGIGVVFTACTVVALDDKMKPLCQNPLFCNNPHSWVKLWKHHGAQNQADRINQLANERNESFIRRYGNKSSSEWLFAKVLETLEKAPDVYENTHLFIEAGDWMVYLLTGNVRKSSCFASYKAFWDKDEGYPSKDFFKALNPRFENVVEEKLGGTDVYPIGVSAGHISKEISHLTGLPETVCVSLANIDAHVSVPALGVHDDGTLLMIMGTSLCHMLVSKELCEMKGLCGVAKDGILPGFYGYELGQSAVGDIFDWFVSNLANYNSIQKVQSLGVNLFDYMDSLIGKIEPGESGVIALDWWNGNRSILMDSDLSGLLIGMTLNTKPEELYRAIVEATAFGTKVILDTLIGGGVKINKVMACGGLSRKSPVTMQIYSDILGVPIQVVESSQACALGGAMYAAVATGPDNGGYEDIYVASNAMSQSVSKTYEPNCAYRAVYDALYEQYLKLHNLFGSETCDVMKKLRLIQKKVIEKQTV